MLIIVFGHLGCKGFKAVRFGGFSSPETSLPETLFRILFDFSSELGTEGSFALKAPDIRFRVAGPTRSSFVPSHRNAGLRFSVICVCTNLQLTLRKNHKVTPSHNNCLTNHQSTEAVFKKQNKLTSLLATWKNLPSSLHSLKTTDHLYYLGTYLLN